MALAPRIAVLTGDQTVLCHMDNSLPDALHYYGDTLHTFLQGSAATLELCVPAQHPDARNLQAGNRLAFKHGQKSYYMTVVTVEATRTVMQIYAEGLVFELLREEHAAYSSTSRSFAEYLKMFGADTGNARINVNEVASKKLALSWDGQQTILARLYSLANSFDAEIEFLPILKPDSTLDYMELNVYKKRPEGRGVGQDKTDTVLKPGKDYQTMRRKIDLSELYTSIRPKGKDGLTLDTYTKPEDEFLLEGGMIRDPEARQLYPSVVHGAQGDGYILYNWQTEYSTQATLYGNAAAELRKHSKPKITYELEGYIQGAQIGDEYTIYDDGFYPELRATARVVEQEICLSDPNKSRSIFDNFTEVK